MTQQALRVGEVRAERDVPGVVIELPPDRAQLAGRARQALACPTAARGGAQDPRGRVPVRQLARAEGLDSREAALKESPLIGEAVVIGDRRKYLTALLTLDEEVARKLAPGVAEPAQLATAEPIRAAIQKQVDDVNQTLARVEQIKKFAILPRPFGVATGELTPTMKIKRKTVSQLYKTEIEAMYVNASDLEPTNP